jgi:hypothetical protein
MFKTLRASRSSAILRLVLALALSSTALQAQRPQTSSSQQRKSLSCSSLCSIAALVHIAAALRCASPASPRSRSFLLRRDRRRRLEDN